MNDRPIIGLHLDLKLLMPRKSGLLNWLREIAGLGVNLLVIEYEDKFPYRESFLRMPGAFEPEELAAFLAEARRLGIRPAPLVQTLAHLEFALTHAQLAEHREAPDILNMICPSRESAVRFVERMIDQVLEYHREDEFFHLAADEAHLLGTCAACRGRSKSVGVIGIWGEHMRRLTRKLLDAGKRPLVWDDIFWKDPGRIEQIDLPRDVVLASWEYAMEDPADEHGVKLSRVDHYQSQGYSVLATPMLNWGILHPRHRHVLLNTRAWAEKVRQSGMLGMLNTSWASQQTPLGVQLPYVAATAAAVRDNADVAGDAWQLSFYRGWFGADCAALPAAIEDLGSLWELTVPDVGRPISPILWQYMDITLHFGGDMARRQRSGFPRDWSAIDFDGIFQRKMELVRMAPDRDAIVSKYDELIEGYGRARRRLGTLAGQATRHGDEADTAAMIAEVKELRARISRWCALGVGDAGALRDELVEQRPRMEEVLLRSFEPQAVERLMRTSWQPEARGMGI